LSGDHAKAKDYYEEGLLLAEEIGSKEVEIYTLNGIGSALIAQGDYSNAILKCKKSLKLAQELGNQQDEITSLGILGLIYDHLGKFKDAGDYLNSSLKIANDIGFQQGECLGLGYLGLIFHHLGEDETAKEHCRKSLEINQELDDPSSEASVLTILGHALVESGMLTEAVRAYQKAWTVRGDLGQHHMAMEALAGLARVYLRQDKLSKAQAKAEEILDHLETQSVNGTMEPLRIYLTCYKVLKANGDLRADKVLNSAHSLLLERANRIEDDDLRLSYLENVAVHREILEEIEKLGDKTS
jgi:tetratricopeptide (TPR) repeat protein